MNIPKIVLVMMLLVVGSQASATPLNDYNLILTGDYNHQGGEVEGATLIGGSVVSTNSPTFATRSFANPVGLSGVGDITAQNVNVNNGKSVRVGGNVNVMNLNMNGGGSVTQDPSFTSATIAPLLADLFDQSATYQGLAANGAFVGDTLTYTGTDDVGVFNVDAADIFAMNTTLKLNAGGAQSVIINVGGSSIDVLTSVNLASSGFTAIGEENIIWNFYEATFIDFANLAMRGAVLAMNADTFGGSVFDGSFAAKSYTGAREFHQYGYNEPVVSVPAPAIAALFLFGTLLVTSRRRHASRG